MGKRLAGKRAIVVGAGQSPGNTFGNGRAISVMFAREGAKVMLVDRRLDSAEETKALIEKEGGQAFAFEADITRTDDCRKTAQVGIETLGGIDILVNVVGVGGENTRRLEITEEEFDRIHGINMRAMMVVCKHVLPVMEKQGSGAVINISSAAAVCDTNMLAYKVSKAGVNALTHYLAMRYAKFGIRANAIMMGLLETPMAVGDGSGRRGVSHDELVKRRNSQIPLKGGMGTAWDTAYAATFLASDEAKFITGVILPVDGGQCAKIG
jgi:NAD(P)-dependent dehydrogenase (short-subunit alcohol dehydrogenase family)